MTANRITLADAFRALMASYHHPLTTHLTGSPVSHEQFRERLAATPDVRPELLSLFAELQKEREASPVLDQWLRCHGIVTRAKAVRV
jgi:hypothetical protein